MLERLFKLQARGTSVKTEFIAGLTTFAAIAYVLAVNPSILAASGMDKAGLITTTALGAAIFTFLMGVMANLPIAVATGMGGNTYVAYNVVIAMGIPWQAALGLIFYNGILFLFLSVTGIRQVLLRAFPDTMKTSLTVGIGLFIMFIGLNSAGVITAAPPPVLISLGNVIEPGVLLCLSSVVVMIVLHGLRIPGAIIMTIIVATLIGFLVPAPGGEGMITKFPDRIVDTPASMASLWLALDLSYLWTHFATGLPVVLTMTFLNLFSSLVAMQAMCLRGGLVDKSGNMLRPRTALSVDALASIGAGLLGNAPMNCYIESATGIESGGRTGLVNVFVALFFLLALFFSPIILIIPVYASAPALIFIGLLMFGEVNRMDFSDLAVGGPATLTIILMPLTTISDGLALGLLSYVLIMFFSGRVKEVSFVSYILGAAFVLYYVAGLSV